MGRFRVEFARFACLLAFLFCLVGLPALTMPPPNAEDVAAYRQDGSLGRRVAAAKQLGNHRVAERLVARAQSRLVQMHSVKGGELPAPPPAWKGMPTKGTVKFFVLAIDFSDFPADPANTVASLQSKIFGEGDANAYPYESLRSFYRRSSYNQLDLTGTVLGWYRPAYPRANLGTDSLSRESLVKEAIAHFKAQGHDFSQYDNDGDGAIDYFSVIWTGPDNGWANFWWAYKTDWNDESFRVDGKKLDTYTWMWLSRPAGGAFSPRILIHETGHALGLPDYYDYNAELGPKGGCGGLDMMDANWGDHNAFSKFLLDWIQPTVVTRSAQGLSLRASGTSPDAILMVPEAANASLYHEYFLIQNRHRVGNDKDLPGDGMLIWHVDARLNDSGQDFRYDNSYAEHKLLRLMEADGLEEIEKGLWANAGDYWTQGMVFGPSSTPRSSRYDGTFTWMGLEGISVPAETMSLNVFTVAPDVTAPEGTPETPIGEAAEIHENRLTFSWGLGTVLDRESPLVAWQVQIGTAPGSADVFDGPATGNMSHTVSGMAQDGTTYFARVRARNGAGLWSAWSAPSQGVTYTVPVFPSSVLDTLGLRFRTFGDGLWTETGAVSHVGTSSAVSPSLTRGQVSHLETRLVGPGTLTYWVRTSCDPWDSLQVTRNGLPLGSFGGETPWTQQTLSIPDGVYTIRWTFRKDTSLSAGADRVWIDGVSYSGGVVPTLGSFSPAFGTPGSAVTLVGSGLTAAAQVAFNGTPARFREVTDGQLQVVVPAGATSGVVTVTTSAGSATSSAAFRVLNLEAIVPGVGRPGDTVLLSGSGFTGASLVAFNGVSTPFTVLSDSRIQTVVPAAATSGLVTVQVPTLTLVTPAPFMVLRVASLAPGAARPGDMVMIDGAGFTGTTRVAFNGTPATFTVLSDTRIQAAVPAGATSGAVSVSTPILTLVSPSSFAVVRVDRLSVSQVTAGGTFEVEGSGFALAESITLNGSAAAFTRISDTRLGVTVPAMATSGTLRLVVAGLVLEGPGLGVLNVLSFAPTAMRPGLSVEVAGSGFTGATRVTVNGVAATFTVLSDARLSLVVPDKATTGVISVTTAAGSASSASTLTVLDRRDLNGDGVVDLLDLALMARSFGLTVGHADFPTILDLNGDGVIDERDVKILFEGL